MKMRRTFSPLWLAAVLIWTLGPTPAMAFPNIGCSYRDTIFNGEVDFGSGDHRFGSPAAPGTVRWSFESINNTILISARVQGTLYLDKLGSGCARIRINFQDINGNNLQSTEEVEFCGPGRDATSPLNQRTIDVTSFGFAALDRVQITLGSGPTRLSIEDQHTGLARAPRTDLTIGYRIDGGNSDFGFRPHQFGAPQQDGSIDMLLNSNGIVFGRVNGILFWDSLNPFSNGRVRAVTDFQDVNGNILATRSTPDLDGTGCCATDTRNQALVDHSFNNANLFKIRLRVGTVSGGRLENVTSKTWSFGCGSTGTAEGIPADVVARVHDHITYGVRWIVPEPENWHLLTNMDVRLIDDNDEILQFRWDEITNDFSQVNPQTGEFLPPALPGSQRRFQSPYVTLLLENSEVIGSGPTGPSVLLNLGLRFKSQAAGRTFTVQARATDDSGLEQGWDSVGEITVLTR